MHAVFAVGTIRHLQASVVYVCVRVFECVCSVVASAIFSIIFGIFFQLHFHILLQNDNFLNLANFMKIPNLQFLQLEVALLMKFKHLN